MRSFWTGFVSRRDEAAEAAFEELMIRHGPMVFRVCRSVLRDTARCRGRVSGRIPGPGSSGEVDSPARVGRKLAVRGRAPSCVARQERRRGPSRSRRAGRGPNDGRVTCRAEECHDVGDPSRGNQPTAGGTVARPSRFVIWKA